MGTIMVVVSAGPPVFLMGITQPVSWLFLGVNAVFAGVVTLMLAAAHRVLAAHDMAHLGRLDALRRVLERLGQAAEPVARCVLRVDLAAASDAPPFSTEYVYMRGKTKLGDALLRIGRDAKEPLTRHRHRWAEVSFELLCGSPVRLVLADEVVYRGGLEERRTSGLSGHFTPNPQAWRLDALPEAFDVGPLRVVRRELAGRTSLAFRCGVQAVEDIAGALEALVAALEPRA
ncbi:MAG: hypothetical protein VKS61_13475 [Candidatus Sericytochromatia bacterium]|nr:hypothetical protein [Candidatus Sericytochromatia bacterium]